MTVFYRLEGTAANGVDYLKLPGFATIPAGAESASVVVAPVDDEIIEGEETVILTLVSPIQPLAAADRLVPPNLLLYRIGEPDRATVVIRDNDDAAGRLPSVMIEPGVRQIAESGSRDGKFILTRRGDTTTGLKVEYEIVTESIAGPLEVPALPNVDFPIFKMPAAENGVDYQKLTGEITIPAGERFASISLDPIDDNLPEGREHVTLKLKPGKLYNLNDPDQATIVIEDRTRGPQVKILLPPSGAIFPVGSEIPLVAFTEVESGFVASVEFFANGKSLGVVKNNPESAAPINPFQMLWKDASAGDHILTATATDNAGRTGVSDPVKVKVIPGPNSTVVTIFASVPVAQEGDPNHPGVFKVVRTGNLKTKLNVRYKVDGTARPNVDYETLPGLITIPAGETSAAIIVKPVVHNSIAGRATVIVKLEQLVFVQPPPPEDDYLVGEPSSATVLILQDFVRPFPPKVAIDSPRSGAQIPSGTDLRVEISTADADGYVPTMELFADDKLIASETRQFLVRPPNGQIEKFEFVWKNVPRGAFKLVARATDDSGLKGESAPVEILVNDSFTLPVLTIKAPDPDTLESQPDKPGRFRIHRSRNLQHDLEVKYTLTGTAENGVDFTKLPGSVKFPAGKEFVDLLVEPVPDKALEGAETVKLTLEQIPFIEIFPPPPGAYLVGEPNSAVVTIHEQPIRNFPPKVAIDKPDSGDVFAENSDIKVRIKAADADGYVTKMELFAGDKLIASESRQYVVRPPNGENVEFDFVWKNVPPGQYRLLARATDDQGLAGESSVVEIIVSNSVPIPTVTIKASEPDVLESRPERPGRFRVQRTKSLLGKIEVKYSIDGTASNGIDYKGLSGNVTMPPGEDSVEILVIPDPDKAKEGNETVVLTLEPIAIPKIFPPPAGAYLVGEPAKATVTIHEDVIRDLPPKVDIVKPQSGSTFAEGTEIAVEVQAADGDGYITLIELFDGRELIGKESRVYVQPPPPGQLEVFNFTLKGKAPGHVLTARATDNDGHTTTSSSVRIVVEDNLPAVSIVAADEEASEADPQNVALFKVTRTGPVKDPLKVYYRVSGNAQNGEDYERLPGVVTIPANEASSTIMVKALGDEKAENREQVTLSLTTRVLDLRELLEANYRIGTPASDSAVILDGPVNRPPKVAIAAPKDGTEFPAKTDIEIKVEATDADGKISQINLFADDKKLAELLPGAPTFLWKEASLGKHVLRAEAIDDRGASGKSEPVLIVVVDPLAAAFVKRDLPDSYTPGLLLKVALEATPASAVEVYAIEDKPPRGWKIENITEGAFDEASGKVKFGPFFDNKPRKFSYDATPPVGESGRREFSGAASANGVNSRIEGDSAITPVSTRHPADNNAGDNAINIRELTAYSTAWKTGQKWPLDPNPIPQSYVTRAGFLWQRGEAYVFDPGQGPAPLWWVPKPKVATQTLRETPPLEDPDSTSDAQGRAIRALSNRGSHRSPLSIEIKVMPKPGVSAQTVEEHPPAGWIVSEISDDGTFDAAQGVIRWGIFFDDKPRTLTYRITPPADASAGASFEGAASFDGAEVPVRGEKNERSFAARIRNLLRHPKGECELSLEGEPGRRYRTQFSEDLVHWKDLGETSSESGEVKILDADAANSSMRYYRVILAE